MNPVIIIATHNRLSVTKKNIECLLRQSVKPLIILVVTDQSEGDYYKKIAPESIIIEYENNKPLGNKWQSGVCRSIELKPNPLIIVGSDDILGKDYIKRACELVSEGNHFIGIQRFWQHYEGKAYLCDYLAHLPIGGGRIYSYEMLDKINFQVFDITKDRHLDDLGFENVKQSLLKVKWVRNTEKEGLNVHAIKGDWPTMNPFTIKHKNLRLLRSEAGKKVLPEYYV